MPPQEDLQRLGIAVEYFRTETEPSIAGIHFPVTIHESADARPGQFAKTQGRCTGPIDRRNLDRLCLRHIRAQFARPKPAHSQRISR